MASIELKEVDFFVIKEDYSRFVLEDGTLLKVKILLRRIFMTPFFTPEGYPISSSFDAENVAVAIVPQNLRREISKDAFDPRVEIGDEIKFINQKINEQEYHTDNGFIVTIRPIVTKIFKYNKYLPPFGEPPYNAQIQRITDFQKIESTSV